MWEHKSNGVWIINCAGLSPADPSTRLSVALVVGLRIAHPHHWRGAAGHSD